MSSKEVAITSCLIYLLTPTFIIKLWARPEQQQLSVLLLTVYLVLYLKSNPSILISILCGFVSTLSFWIHPTTSFISIVALVILGLCNLKIKSTLLCGLGVLLGTSIYITGFVMPNYDVLKLQYHEWAYVFSTQYQHTDISFLLNHKIKEVITTAIKYFLSYSVIPFTAVTVISAVFTFKHSKDFFLKIWLPCIPGIFLSAVLACHDGLLYLVYYVPFCAIVCSIFFISFRHALVKICAIIFFFYMILAQLYTSYSNRNEDFKKICKEISDTIKDDGAIMASENYNYVLNRKDYFAPAYHMFYRIIKSHNDTELLNKYSYLYGNSLADFIKINRIKYIIIDRSCNITEEELEKENIQLALHRSFPSKYGTERDGLVKVYIVL
jgi:hypothetical protein